MKKMQFFLIEKLLYTTTSLCLSSYFCILLSTLIFINTSTGIFKVLLMAAIIVLGLIQHYFYIRIHFDYSIFKEIRQSNSENFQENLKDLDESLISLKLIPQHQAGKPLLLRYKGCKKLLIQQIILIALQYLILISILI